jgi:hypothetical protein
MTTTGTPARPETSGPAPRARAAVGARTLRRDRWWLQPVSTGAVLLAFVVYATWAAFQNADYFAAPYLSPFYSPCLATSCVPDSSHLGQPVGDWWGLSPALIILVVPLGFRLTCYYYRKAYYRAFWLSPPACAVGEPHRRYTGETRFPLVLQNVHRYFFYLGFLLNFILTFDAVIAFRDAEGEWGHMGLGTLVLTLNALLLWLYTLSCHSCRHVVGGRLTHFSRHPARYWAWTQVSRLNGRHMQIAWASLVWVALTDLYVRLVASGALDDPTFF